MSNFDLNFDDQPINNSSALVSQKIEQVNKDKYHAKTFTKGFFNQDEDHQYNNDDNGKFIPPSPQKNYSKKEQEPSRRRRKKQPIKLAPLQQLQKVQVFENTNKQGQDENQLQEFNIPSSKPEPKIEEQVQKPAKRKRPKIVFDDNSQEEGENTKAEPTRQQPRFVQQNVRDTGQFNQTNEEISVPQGRNVLNQFEEGSSDEDPPVEAAQPLNVVGSGYFNYNPTQGFKKQLMEDIRPGNLLRMQLVRDKSGFNTFWPQFHLYFSANSHYVMSAKKTSSKPCSTFILSINKSNYQQSSPYYLGKMKSNVLGDVLNIFGPGLNPSNARQHNQVPRQLLATIVYSSNLFQMGKPREFTVFVKKPQVKYYQAFPQVRMYDDQIPLSTLHQNPQNRDKILVYCNRKPQWIQHLGGYMLNFRGRVQTASIKNFILEGQPEGPELMLFGKVNESQFNLDMMSQISPIVAFGIALSSFDSRIMCE